MPAPTSFTWALDVGRQREAASHGLQIYEPILTHTHPYLWQEIPPHFIGETGTEKFVTW